MSVRHPAVAGQFYPDSRNQCLDEIAECLREIGESSKLGG